MEIPQKWDQKCRNGTGFQERLTWLGETYFSSIKTMPKYKVQIFHYVPHT